MGIKHYRVAGTRVTPQSEPVPGLSMIKNDAGGYVFDVGDWERLNRFLILGTEGATYYTGERELTLENAAVVGRCINADGRRVVRTIVEISESGRAPKNDPALFALAMCFALGDVATKHDAEAALPKVARIGTHLFHFADFVSQFRGWGKVLKRAVARWYEDKDPDNLAYQAVKYRQRDGWAHRDLLRLSHPDAGYVFTDIDDAPISEASDRNAGRRAVFDYICGREDSEFSYATPKVILGYELAQKAGNVRELVNVITEYNLPREAVPTAFLNEPAVWEALLQKMPLEAMIRNLGNMSKIGLLVPGSQASALVTSALSNADHIRASRLHPIKLLVALRTYAGGIGWRGHGEWTPVTSVVNALDSAFYAAFQNVEPTGKRILIGLDDSGSMASGSCAGVPNLTPAEGSLAMALITLAADPDTVVTQFSTTIRSVLLSPRQRLDDALKAFRRTPQGTNCALPIEYAIKSGVPVDAFVLYTDNQTWAGNIHPVQELRRYREKTGIPARFVVVGMVPNAFSVAAPDDPLSMDVVGFDTAAPQVISDFITGKI